MEAITTKVHKISYNPEDIAQYLAVTNEGAPDMGFLIACYRNIFVIHEENMIRPRALRRGQIVTVEFVGYRIICSLTQDYDPVCTVEHASGDEQPCKYTGEVLLQELRKLLNHFAIQFDEIGLDSYVSLTC